jgi:hypothetical protein
MDGAPEVRPLEWFAGRCQLNTVDPTIGTHRNQLRWWQRPRVVSEFRAVRPT